MDNNVVPIRGLLTPEMTIEKARQDGYTILSPIDRAVAIEFATTGHTLKQVAADLDQPLSVVRQAFGNPITRAFIADLQAEIAQHKVINAVWVEQQVLAIWPQLIGEEDVNLVNKSGEQITAKKFHGPEVASIIKHFSGNGDQKKAGGVQVVINFGDMGVDPRPVIEATVVTHESGLPGAQDA